MNDVSLRHASELDASDHLADFREQFFVPDQHGKPLIYLCGNSLGLQPKTAARYVTEELDDWHNLGVEGHLQARRPWLPYHENLANLTAELIGATTNEVVSMNTLTVNLHLLMVSFYRPTADRYKILIERPAFPSDRYAVVSQIRFHGFDPTDALLEVGPRGGESWIRNGDIASVIESEGDRIALILFSGVQYYSGQFFDMETITQIGHRAGCVVGFDLAHAAGNVPLHLHDWDVDFAAWCNYKYINGGPGAVAGCFIHERHALDFKGPRFTGWWGHDKDSRFKMEPDFRPIRSAEAWQLSNPPILSLAPVLASLEIFHAASMNALRAKSVALTGYLEQLLEQRLGTHVETLTPRDPERRGCQISLRVTRGIERGRALFDALGERGVVVDWREPDVIRVAPVPLYNTFADVWDFVDILKRLLDA